MASNSEKFRYNSAFRSDIALQSVVFTNDAPLLEIELNEIQDIQNEKRQSIARTLTPSGFVEIVDKNFAAAPIVYKPVSAIQNTLNCIAIAPCKVVVNGLNINLTGDFATDEASNYLLLDLGEAPLSGTRDDLIYLEVWIERLTFNDIFHKEGYLKGNQESYQILDSRINMETTRRTVICYDIKVANNVDFKLFADGLGYESVNKFANIQATVDGTLGYGKNNNLIFRPANDLIFKNEKFYQDANLYVAGRPDYTLANENIVGKYIFALPMFKVKRKNQRPYSLANFNGTRSSIHKYLEEDSSVNGDLLAKIRPDKVFYDVIDEKDVTDLRRSVSTDILNEYYLNKSLKQLFTGNLQTKEKQQMRRVQFGRQYVDYTENDAVLLHVEFNNNIDPTEIENLASTVEFSTNELSYTPEYRDAILAQGLYIDGRAEYKYIVPRFKNSEGTIDFYMQPNWNGHSDINQTIFIVIDVNGNNVFTCKKYKSQLLFNIVFAAATADHAEIAEQIVVDLTNHLIFAKRIYMIRIAWNDAANIHHFFVYLNGVLVGQTDFSGTILIPHAIIIGNKTDAVVNAGLVITDEEIAEEQSALIEDEPIYKEKWLDSTEAELAENALAVTKDNHLISNYTNLYVEVDQQQYSFNNALVTDISYKDESDEQTDLYIEQNNLKSDELYLLKESDQSNIRVITEKSLTDDEIRLILAEEQRRILDEQEKIEQDVNNDYLIKKNILKRINKRRTNNNYGFVIEELVIYSKSFEENINDGTFVYTNNTFWPGLPNDFIAGNALLLPSFNSIYRCYSDEAKKQEETLQIVNGENGIFRIQSTDERKIETEPTIYKITGEVNSLGQILPMAGVWKFIKDEWIFQARDITTTSAVVTYTFNRLGGNGFEDLPEEILSAGFVDAENVISECSFARINTENYRPISYLFPKTTNGDVDRAYDHSMNKGVHSCFARVMYYHISGNRTNTYMLPNIVYGMPIISIFMATNRVIENIKKLEDGFQVILTEAVPFDDTIEFVLALGGTTFDYNTQTKTLITNILRTQSVTFTSDGIHNQYLIPLYTQNGGILHSACSVVEMDEMGNEVFKHACYVGGEMYPYLQDVNKETGKTLNTFSNRLAEVHIDETSWNTPFMKIALDFTPAAGTTIEIPVQVTYQPTQYDVLSIWYNYMPYQGILGQTHKKLKRLTDWKYFITTLSSGKDVLLPEREQVRTLNTLVNRLPGGNALASYLTGEKIVFKEDLSQNALTSLFNFYTISETEVENEAIIIENRIKQFLKEDANYELRFLNKALFASESNKLDNSFFELEIDMEVYKQTIGFQDEKINYTFNKFKAYLPDSLMSISKYTGMACLVVDENGEIMLFIMGSINNGNVTNNKKERENIIEPIYGDLFRLDNLPTTLQRSFSASL